jgi:hypothetical protein
MIKKIFAAIVVVIVGILVYAATLPDTFRVQRTTNVKAPPEIIFSKINDFHKWTEWSPWEKLDPDMKRNYLGLAAGQGARYAWEGNDKVGAGSMEITLAESPHRIGIKLDFIRPFEGHNTAEFLLAGKGDYTEVTWSMSGPSPYPTKVMAVFFSMDRMVGKDFETGLANLKAVVEK